MNKTQHCWKKNKSACDKKKHKRPQNSVSIYDIDFRMQSLSMLHVLNHNAVQCKSLSVHDINASQQTRILVIRRNLCTPVPTSLRVRTYSLPMSRYRVMHTHTDIWFQNTQQKQMANINQAHIFNETQIPTNNKKKTKRITKQRDEKTNNTKNLCVNIDS